MTFPRETSRRLACDGSRVVMTHAANGQVLDVGRKTRVIPPALRRALAHRDTTCQFPGCDRTLCDAHHVRHWADGGATSLDNLLLLCRRHHRCVHEEGYTAARRGDGTVRFISPQGRVIPPVGPPPDRPGAPADPMVALEGELLARGVTVGVPPCPDSASQRFDLGWALDVMYRREGGGETVN